MDRAKRKSHYPSLIAIVGLAFLFVVGPPDAQAQTQVHFYRDDALSSMTLERLRYSVRDWPGQDEFNDAQGDLDVEALRQALQDARAGKLLQAARRAGIQQVLERELEDLFLRATELRVEEVCLESLQMIRGAQAGAAAVKYLAVKKHPLLRRDIYWQIAMSAGDTLTTLSAQLDKRAAEWEGIMRTQEQAMIIEAMGRIPTYKAGQKLMAIYDGRSSETALRQAALKGLGNLGKYRIPLAERLSERPQHTQILNTYNKEVDHEKTLTDETCAELRAFVLLHSKDESEAVRQTVARIARFMETRDAYRTLETMMREDPSTEIREAARKWKLELDELAR